MAEPACASPHVNHLTWRTLPCYQRQSDFRDPGHPERVDTILRERLAAVGLKIPHILLAVAPIAAGVMRSSVGPEGLADRAEQLAAIAIEAAARKPDNEPLN